MVRKSLNTVAVTAMLAVWPAVSFAGSIDILEVRYGTFSSNRSCDATATVGNICNGTEQCNVDVNNTSLCGDPDFLVVKKIMIKYKCGWKSRPVSLVGDEYSNFALTCR